MRRSSGRTVVPQLESAVNVLGVATLPSRVRVVSERSNFPPIRSIISCLKNSNEPSRARRYARWSRTRDRESGRVRRGGSSRALQAPPFSPLLRTMGSYAKRKRDLSPTLSALFDERSPHKNAWGNKSLLRQLRVAFSSGYPSIESDGKLESMTVYGAFASPIGLLLYLEIHSTWSRSFEPPSNSTIAPFLILSFTAAYTASTVSPVFEMSK